MYNLLNCCKVDGVEIVNVRSDLLLLLACYTFCAYFDTSMHIQRVKD